MSRTAPGRSISGRLLDRPRDHRGRRRGRPRRPARQARAALDANPACAGSRSLGEWMRPRWRSSGPAQRRERVIETLREDARRLIEDARPGSVSVVYAETQRRHRVDRAGRGRWPLPARAGRLAGSAAAALSDAIGLSAPVRAGDAELEAARWSGLVASAPPTRRPSMRSSCSRWRSRITRTSSIACASRRCTARGRSGRDRTRRRRALALASRDGHPPRRPARSRPPSRPKSRQRSRASSRSSTRRQRSTLRSRMTPSRAGVPRGACSAASTAWASTAGTTPSSGISRAASPGHERALALEVGEALVRAGYLAEKPSVGQRHVSLVPARTSDIRELIERGTCEEPLSSQLA